MSSSNSLGSAIPNVELITPMLTSIPAESSGLPESSLPIDLKPWQNVAHSKYAMSYLELLI